MYSWPSFFSVQQPLQVIWAAVDIRVVRKIVRPRHVQKIAMVLMAKPSPDLARPKPISYFSPSDSTLG